jgi:hypothetical protein
MKIARYKFLTIAIFACFVFPHAGIATAQTDKEEEIKRIYKQLIDAENKHDLPAVRARGLEFSFNSLRCESTSRLARVLGHRRRYATPTRYVSAAISD